MGNPLAELRPRALWGHFASLAAIPRPSKREERVLDWGQAGFSQADFHDLVTRFETFIDQSDTRVVAFYRLNRLEPDSEIGGTSSLSSRFDVRLMQRLPFLQSMTRADWELLVAYRNLFYEENEGALLDEIAVVDPPRQLMGGIAIKF